MKINNKLIEKNILTASFVNYKSTGSLSPITGLTLVSQSGQSLILQNNGIKIGPNISKVLISGWAFNNTNSSGASFIGGITKNGEAYNESDFNASFWEKSASTNDNITLALPPTMINVSENDVVNFGAAINGNTTNVFNRGCVTVEVVK